MKKKKNKKALGWWQKLSAGDPEKNIEIFNNMMNDHPNISSESSGSTSETAMAEAIDSIRQNPETNLEALKALELEERFDNEKELEKHFYKHCRAKELNDATGKYEDRKYDPRKYTIWWNIKNKKEYENKAEKAQDAKVDKNKKHVLGYEIDDKYKLKYNKDENSFVKYTTENGEDITITYYGLHPTWGPVEYIKRKNDDEAKSNSFRELSIGEALKELK